MKTSKLTLRPFMPLSHVKGLGYNPLPNARREEYATLSYGGVTIQLDYTILRWLKLNYNDKRVANIFRLGLDEILTEMAFNHAGREKPSEIAWFRDNPKKCSITHPISTLAKEVNNWENVVDGTRTMVWEKMDKED